MVYAVFRQDDVEKDGFKTPTITYKIGRTRDFTARLRALQTGSHKKIDGRAVDVEDDVAVEKLLHMAFAPYRVRGEWFRLPPKQVKLLNRVLNTLSGRTVEVE